MQIEDCNYPQQQNQPEGRQYSILRALSQMIIFMIQWILDKIKAMIQIIVNLIMMCVGIAIISVLLRYYCPDHAVTNKLNLFVGNVTVLMLGDTEDVYRKKNMLSLVESYHSQLKKDVKVNAVDVDYSDIKYDHLVKFSNIIIGEFFNLTDLKTAIREGPIPPEVSIYVLKPIVPGNFKYCPSSLDYTANADKSGGAGFKYCLTVQKPGEMYQMIFTIAGRQFTVATDIEYREETTPEVVSITSSGYLGGYKEDKIVVTTQQKKVVKPKYISEAEFEAIVHQTYIEYAHQEATKQLEAEVNKIKKMIGN